MVHEVGGALRTDTVIGAKILEDIEIQSRQEDEASAIILRCRFSTVALEQRNVHRKFLLHHKDAFNARGFEISYPH